jgi:hypothetical protein
MALSVETMREIERLATDLVGLFTPPELIPGCEVMSVADKDLYATDNGWIEAVVGQHNQQRCRWRGQFVNVQVGNYVDVLYFASYRLFVVFGQGGIGATPAGGKIYQLWESDGGAVAFAIDADGNLEDQQGRTVVAKWYDYPLIDTINNSGITSHFRDNDSSFPSGWTENDAPKATNTNDIYSFWRIVGSNSNTSWEYYRQSLLDLEGGSENVHSFILGPVLFRYYNYSADVDYYFSICANNAGAIDATIYGRAHLQWDSASSLWRIRGEEADGAGGSHSGSWVNLDIAPLRPIFLRVAVFKSTKLVRVYVGDNPIALSHRLIFEQTPTSAPTYGQMWARLHQSRGAGADDYIWFGAIDYEATG